MTQRERDLVYSVAAAFLLMAVASLVRLIAVNAGIEDALAVPLSWIDLFGPVVGLVLIWKLRR
jgi:hypothetical protein